MFDLRELKKYGLVAADIDIVDPPSAREDIRVSGRQIGFMVLEEEGPGGRLPRVLVIAKPDDLRWLLREWCFDEEFITDFLRAAMA